MYAFVHIEKTGGSTLNTILRRSFGTRHCDIRLPLAKRRGDCHGNPACIEAADVRRVLHFYRNLRGISGHNVKAYGDLASEVPDLRFITVVRDPVARFRSHFVNRARGHDRAALDEWLARCWVQNWQTKMIAGEPNAEKAIELIATRFGFIGLTERFDESLLLFGQWLGEPGFCPIYHAANRTSEKRRPRDLSRRRSDMSYLDTPEVRAILLEANAEDQRVYNYVTTHVYPRQVAKYPGNLAADLAEFQRRNRDPGHLREPLWGRVMRNYIYKPLIHCHVV